MRITPSKHPIPDTALHSYVLRDERDSTRLAVLNVWRCAGDSYHIVLAFGSHKDASPSTHASLGLALDRAIRVLDA